MRLGYSPVTAAMLDLDAAYRLAVELELEFVELSYDLFEAVPQLQSQQQVRELRDATGIGSTLHLSFVDLNLASVAPAARRSAVERTLKGLEYAEAVGSSCGVLHTGRNLIPYPQAAQLAELALEKSLSELSGANVPIALENLALDPGDLIKGPKELQALTERHDMSNCLDFGHAHVEGERKGQRLIGSYLEKMGERLIHLHIHNNYGVNDEHLPTSQGTLLYEGVLQQLTGFGGTACLEIAGGEEAVREAVAHFRGLVAA